MEEQLISFETAKLAKEKGFGGKELTTLNGYFRGGILCNIPCNNKSDFCHEDEFSAPTQSLLQKWLREIYNIHIIVYIMENSNGSVYYDFGLKQVINWLTDKSSKPREFLTYEEALEVGLQKALKLI